ncbi:unnamed protein product [Schistosoma curassoni]|uniref:Phosphoenolpyruvate carboxylase n=1 Tax=Schistosoma curassoni TaxID=6186 RepID=A0A183L7L5_9TREM|nr:unnamed protein product [Schistosoma curassoni]
MTNALVRPRLARVRSPFPNAHTWPGKSHSLPSRDRDVVYEIEKRISDALTSFVDTESPLRGIGKTAFQTNGAHGFQYPEETNGV